MASLLCLPLVVQRKIFEKLDFQTRLGVEIHWFQKRLDAVIHGPLGLHWKIRSGSVFENPKPWTRVWQSNVWQCPPNYGLGYYMYVWPDQIFISADYSANLPRGIRSPNFGPSLNSRTFGRFWTGILTGL